MEEKALKRRYRQENGVYCIDLKLQNYRQLFDERDPAPFRERDLDDDAADYIITAAKEFSWFHNFKLVVHLPKPSAGLISDATIAAAIKSYFVYEADISKKRISNLLKEGYISLVIGLTCLTTLLTFAHYLDPTGESKNSFIIILREALHVMSWVAMWRPTGIFLYDWWPMMMNKRLYQRIAGLEYEVHHY